MKRLLLISALLVPLTGACGGRAHLEDTVGVNFRAAVDAQRGSRPTKPVAALSGEDAKLILANRRATLTVQGAQGDGGSSSGGLDFGGAMGGQMTPMTSDLGSSGGGDVAPIKFGK